MFLAEELMAICEKPFGSRILQLIKEFRMSSYVNMMKIQNSARYSREALSKVENAMKKEFLYEEEEPEESVVKSEPAIKVETGKGKKTDSPKDFEEHSFKEINTGSSEIEEVIENPAVRVQTNKDHNIDSLNKDEIPEDEMLMKEMMHKKQFEWVEKMFAMTEEELTWDGFYMLIATVISKNMLLHQTKFSCRNNGMGFICLKQLL
eukprot:TRINITY_DN10047_c0_g1_i10.p1 TRINITY_DN10047_c0_g1~~TRINITY_DN10047_c0_g1_i10.p1  ORF type:complete len:223 (-),score=45.03 TRINITY_DN10047_c0_g1_i10:322-939(-)